MKLIDDWKQVWKWYSTHAMVIYSNDRTAGGALDLILRLRGELQKADSQLKHIRENYVENKAQ